MDWRKWKLCLDTGHLVWALHDPLAVFMKWAGTVASVHCKDSKAAQFADISARLPMKEIHEFCTEVGRGVVDFPVIVGILDEADYEGWLVVEQDHSDTTPYESARISREYLGTIIQGKEMKQDH